MAIVLDEQAQAAVARRRARGLDDALLLRIARIPARGVIRVMDVAWAPRNRPQPRLTERRVGDILLFVDPRIARYTNWHDLRITAAWRLGPFDRLLVVDEPLVLLKLEEWTRLHPAPPLRPAA